MPASQRQKARNNGLTDKQVAFVDEYCTNGYNAVQASLAAGYTAAVAQAQSSRTLASVGVQKEIDKRKAELARKSEVTAEFLTQERLSAVERCKARGLESPLDKHLQALDKHIGYYEADNAQQAEKTLMLSEEQWSELMARRAQLEAQAACIDVTAAIAT